jgi:hypothetical protein
MGYMTGKVRESIPRDSSDPVQLGLHDSKHSLAYKTATEYKTFCSRADSIHRNSSTLTEKAFHDTPDHCSVNTVDEY